MAQPDYKYDAAHVLHRDSHLCLVVRVCTPAGKASVIRWDGFNIDMDYGIVDIPRARELAARYMKLWGSKDWRQLGVQPNETTSSKCARR